MILLEFGFGIFVGLVIILLIFRSSEPKKKKIINTITESKIDLLDSNENSFL